MDNLSLIIPLYNEENRIKKNLRVIQNFLKKRNVEVVFVNDGSNDNSDEIIRKFISKIKKKKNY